MTQHKIAQCCTH